MRHFVGQSIDKIVVQQQSNGHVEAAVIIVQVQVADLLNFFQQVDKGVAVKKKLPGGLHHVAVVGQVDAQRLEVVGAVGPVVLEQLLEMPVVQDDGALPPVYLAVPVTVIALAAGILWSKKSFSQHQVV